MELLLSTLIGDHIQGTELREGSVRGRQKDVTVCWPWLQVITTWLCAKNLWDTPEPVEHLLCR